MLVGFRCVDAMQTNPVDTYLQCIAIDNTRSAFDGAFGRWRLGERVRRRNRHCRQRQQSHRQRPGPAYATGISENAKTALGPARHYLPTFLIGDLLEPRLRRDNIGISDKQGVLRAVLGIAMTYS